MNLDENSVNQTVWHGDEWASVNWFDYGEVDQLLGELDETSQDARREAAECISKLLAWIWTRQNLKAATTKFVALSAALRPDLLGNQTYRELAEQCGCKKQNLSKATIAFSDAFQIKFARSRSDVARNNMRLKAIGHKPTNVRKPHVTKSVLP